MKRLEKTREVFFFFLHRHVFLMIFFLHILNLFIYLFLVVLCLRFCEGFL